MCIGFCEEFHRTCSSQLFKTFKDIRCVEFKLVQCYSGNGKCNLKPSLIFFYHFKQNLIGRQITFISYLSQDAFVGIIIIIVMFISNIEESVSSETEGLMNLKI